MKWWMSNILFLRPLEIFENDKHRSVNLVLNQLILVLVQIPKLFLKSLGTQRKFKNVKCIDTDDAWQYHWISSRRIKICVHGKCFRLSKCLNYLRQVKRYTIKFIFFWNMTIYKIKYYYGLNPFTSSLILYYEQRTYSYCKNINIEILSKTSFMMSPEPNKWLKKVFYCILLLFIVNFAKTGFRAFSLNQC